MYLSMDQDLTHDTERSLPVVTALVRGVVLLGEDDAAFREALASALHEEGFHVLSAGSGRDMLTILSAIARDELPTPDCIVLDIRMPSYTGLDLLMAMRLAGWRTRVVLMTAFGDTETHERARALGAHAVLNKPFELTDLLKLLPG